MGKALLRCEIGQRGVVSVEFAMTGAIVMALTLGGAELSKYLFTLQTLRTATAEVVRQVTLLGGANISAGATPCQGLLGAVQNPATRVKILDSSQLTATMSGCASGNGVTTVNIALRYPYEYTMPIFGRRSEVLAESATAMFN